MPDAKLVKFAFPTEKADKLSAMLKLARSELPILPAEMDRDKSLYNVANGTIELTDARLPRAFGWANRPLRASFRLRLRYGSRTRDCQVYILVLCL